MYSKDMGTKELYTKRLLLRPYKEEDATVLHQKFGCNPAMFEYSGWNPYATIDMAKDTVERFIDNYKDPHFYGWAIEMNGELVGTIGAYDYDGNQIEVGLSIDEDHWNQGIASEALDAVLRFLHDEEGVPHIVAWCANRNIGSQKAMEKAGMGFKEIQCKALEIDDVVYDKLIYQYPSAHVELKIPSQEDTEALVYICNRVDRKYLADRMPNPYTEKDAAWFINVIKENDGKNGVWRLIEVDGQPVGVISVEKEVDVYRVDGEIGYYLLNDYHSKGIMTQAVFKICQIAFDTLDLIRITGRYVSDNIPSGKVLEKTGFQYEGKKRCAVIKNDKVYDLCITGLLKEEWLNR